MDPRIETIIALMNSDERRRLSLRKMAKTVNLSPAHLCYLFKAQTGTPPARYLRKLRMKSAATLLEETFLSVKEIRARTGFNDESHFVRDFKRAFGMCPTEY
ncbi:MAG: helix-turn-helix transcriptional regulator, partial [Pyrinomonadaceae bacterium]